jgi:hypothetical protein
MGKRTTQLGISVAMGVIFAAVMGCTPTPQVEGISPGNGAEKGGNTVTITGRKFHTKKAQVDFGGAILTPTSVTKTEISVTAPAGDVGSVQVTVQNTSDKRAESSVTYTYLDTTPPTVQGFTPSDGQSLIQGTDYEDAVNTGVRTIRVTFSEPIQRANVAVSYAALSDAINAEHSGAVAGSVSVAGSTATFTADADLSSARQYKVSAEGTDTAGNTGPAVTSSFGVATPTRVHWYSVRKGDTLQSIAARPDTYDDAELWKRILIVNQDYHELDRNAPQAGLKLALNWTAKK